MLTLLGSLLGFGTSFLPSVLNFFKEKRDQKHELALMDKQAELARDKAKIDYAAAGLEAEIREVEALHKSDRSSGVAWVDGYRGTVRPTVTYIFMGIFCFVEISLMIMAMRSGMDLFEASQVVWTESVQAMFATILAFWFGGRQFGKRAA